MRWRISGLVLVGFTTLSLALSSTPPVSATTTHRDDVDPSAGIMNLDHLIFVVQENRSFDHYFGTFPGADGLPQSERPRVASASPIPQPGIAGARTTTRTSTTRVGRTTWPPRRSTVSGGTMQGSIRAFEAIGTTCQHHPRDACDRADRGPAGQPDVMGYHTAQRDPELLGVRAHVRPAGSHVRPVGFVDVAVAPLPGVGVVGDVPPTDGSDELSLGSAVPRQQRGRQRPDLEPGRRDTPAVRVGGHHVAAVERRGQLGRTTWGGERASSHRASLARSPTATRSRIRSPASAR